MRIRFRINVLLQLAADFTGGSIVLTRPVTSIYRIGFECIRITGSSEAAIAYPI